MSRGQGRLKVLVSAYSCAPERGSEPAVGWNLALGLARHHDVWVITRARNRDAIARELARLTEPLPRFHYVDLPAWARFWKHGSPAVALYYDLWQSLARRAVQQLHARIGFDVAHHATFAKYTSPSALAGLGAPWVWGPVGGGESMPASFARELPWRGRAYESLRALARRAGEGDPRVRATARTCALALASTEETAARLRALGARDVRVLSQVGALREDLSDPPSARGAMQPFRMLSIGRLLHWKGFHLGLRAFAAARLPDAEYWILGQGPAQRSLRELAGRLGIEHRVHFMGNLPRARVLDQLRRAHLLVHPSLHESGGWVCSEALAAGCPVACLDLGGPALQVSDDAGFRIAAVHPERAVAELAEALAKLASDRWLFERKSRDARQLASRELSWERKCEQISDLYRSLVEGAR